MTHEPPARRVFIKQLTLGAGALVLPKLRASAESGDKRLGVALVGLGHYSSAQLAPALEQTKHCYLAGIVTGTPTKIETWQKRYRIPDRNVYTYENFDRVADNPHIDVVYVVLPNALHAQYTLRAAKAGKHVWCEKPMALTVTECEAMIQACRDSKVSLAIGYRMQHEPNTQTVIRYGRERTYGAVKSVSAAAGFFGTNTGHWRLNKALGGGAMYDMGVYPLQAARYCTGEEPAAVTAKHATNRPDIFTEVDETTTFDLEFPSGAVAHCKTSFGISMNSLRVNCENGWYQLEPFQSYTGVRGVTSDGRVLSPSAENQQARQMDDDALAILRGLPLRVPGEEGLRDIRVVEAVFKSAKAGQRIVL